MQIYIYYSNKNLNNSGSMSEPVLKALIKLFVLISEVCSVSEISNNGKDIVKLFLQRQISSDLVKK